MNIDKWLKNNTSSLINKTVAITGSTGGLGGALCEHIAGLGGNFILLDRNKERSYLHACYLREKFGVEVKTITLDLENMENVASVTNELKKIHIDFFIHNAGAYSIPRHKTDCGFDNVFQINFLSPYYMTRELMHTFSKTGGKFIFVGSIAHNYSKLDEADIDFSTRKAHSKVYGNAKRWIMCSAYYLTQNGSDNISLTHPGISFTNITAHYPRVIFALIKNPMKIIFPKPKNACLSILYGMFTKTKEFAWIGPNAFNVWGFPRKKKLNTIEQSEISFAGKQANVFYIELKKKYGGNI